MFSGTTIDRFGPGPAVVHRLADGLWFLAIIVRVVAVLALAFGPWTNQSEELQGWDAERFQQIAERDIAGWSDFPIEYPPGSVVVLDAVSGHSVVETSRNIVLLAAATELITVLMLWRRVGSRAAKAFLVLGLPLVPIGLVRLDLLAVVLAVAAALLLLKDQSTNQMETRKSPAVAVPVRRLDHLGFGLLVAAGAMVKIWPALLVLGAVALRRWRAAAGAVFVTGVTGVLWLLVVGDGISPIDQVLSLRGATGWHVESLPGAMTALLSSEQATLELNAFRIGTLNAAIVGVGRVIALAMMAALALAANRQTFLDQTERFALVMLGSVAVLVVTAPLLSPQFVLWLLPWGSLLFAGNARLDQELRKLVTVLALTLVLTGATLAIFGPPNLADTVPALLLTVRNIGLLALPILCLRRLHQPSPAEATG